MDGVVASVSRSAGHTFWKAPQPGVLLVEGFGVEGDAHGGASVRHRSRVARDPSQPNLRQVHLLHAELYEALREVGFAVAEGEIGENILTRGVDLLAAPTGTRVCLGESAVVELRGLRNPCVQLDRFRPGLMAAVLDRGVGGALIRRAGVMGVVRVGGVVRPGDPIRLELPEGPHLPLGPV